MLIFTRPTGRNTCPVLGDFQNEMEGSTMSEKSDKLRAMLEKEKERRIKLNNRIEILERRIQEEDCRGQRDGADCQGHAGTACRPAAAVGCHHPEPGRTVCGGCNF